MKYTIAFNEIDPDGEKQIDVEEKIAWELFANDGEVTLTEMSFTLAEIVDKTFGRVNDCSLLQIGKMILQVRTYLKHWHRTLDSSYGAHEGECADASKELLLLILSYVYPEYVEKEDEK